ncbi:UbiA-like polyprenyltransferase [Phosphitispora fastidiosa]|uniref:UbiA-like polyprenyltransferase n=1 Tax=Phosphitispora fastidiosa TaxID=2837202 RepID=UPI001E3075A9|nr:UbiA-like polyprenyltransferase [Phosphitispora fastidiosa]
MAFARVRHFGEMIKFEHTVFALPFALMGAFLAKRNFPTGYELLWITLAMVGARTAAMALNRLIDRHIDARNPRTAGRHLPKGILSVAEVWVYVALSWALLLIAAWQLNPLDLPVPLTVKLMPIAVLVLTLYSYTKRFTWACHLVLGLSLGLAPVGSWVGVAGRVELPAVILGFVVIAWVAGFDMIYACQDYEFDRKEGIHSVPAIFGLKWALVFSGLLHVLTIVLLVWDGLLLGMGYFYWLGIILAAGILIYEHSLVTPTDLSKLDAAFFNMNGILSVMLFVFTFADIIFGLKISL